MVYESVQQGFSANDHGVVLFVPGVDGILDPDAPTVDELTAAGVVKLTYGLTPDGYQLANTQNKITTGRYTMSQELTVDGTTSDALTLTYVYNRVNPTDVEAALGERGAEGFIVHALGYENDHVFAESDVINEVVPVRLSQAIAQSAAANAEPTKTQRPNITGRVAREAVVAAGA